MQHKPDKTKGTKANDFNQIINFSSASHIAYCTVGCLMMPAVPNLDVTYRMRAIITRGLYILNPLFEDQKLFFIEVFSEKSAFMLVSIQEWFITKRVMIVHG